MQSMNFKDNFLLQVTNLLIIHAHYKVFIFPLTCQSFELICGKHIRGGFIHCEGQKTQKLMIDHFYNKEDQLVRKMPYGVIELIFVLPNGIMFHT